MELSEQTASTSIYLKQIHNQINHGEGYNKIREMLFKELHMCDGPNPVADDKLAETIVFQLAIGLGLNTSVKFPQPQKIFRSLQIVSDLLTYCQTIMTQAMHTQLFVNTLANVSLVSSKDKISMNNKRIALGIFSFWFQTYGRERTEKNHLFLEKYQKLSGKKMKLPQSTIVPVEYKPQDYEDRNFYSSSIISSGSLKNQSTSIEQIKSEIEKIAKIVKQLTAQEKQYVQTGMLKNQSNHFIFLPFLLNENRSKCQKLEEKYETNGFDSGFHQHFWKLFTERVKNGNELSSMVRNYSQKIFLEYSYSEIISNPTFFNPFFNMINTFYFQTMQPQGEEDYHAIALNWVKQTMLNFDSRINLQNINSKVRFFIKNLLQQDKITKQMEHQKASLFASLVIKFKECPASIEILHGMFDKGLAATYNIIIANYGQSLDFPSSIQSTLKKYYHICWGAIQILFEKNLKLMPILMKRKQVCRIFLNISKIDLHRGMKIVEFWERNNNCEVFFQNVFSENGIEFKEKGELLDVLKAQRISYSGRISAIADYFLQNSPDI